MTEPTTFDEYWNRLSWGQKFRIHMARDYERIDWQVALNKERASAERSKAAYEDEHAEMCRALDAAITRAEKAEAERDHLRTLGQGQRVIDLIKRHEALQDEHADCLTASRQRDAVIDAAIEWASDDGDGITVDGQHQSTEDLCERLGHAVNAYLPTRAATEDGTDG